MVEFSWTSSPSKFLERPPCSLKYTNDLDGFIADSIWNDVRRSGHNQFASADYSAGPAHRGMPRESRDRRFDHRNDSSCGVRVVLRDVLSLSVEIGSRFAKPPNAHGASTS